MKKIRLILLLLFTSQCGFSQPHWDSLYGGLNQNVTCFFADTVTDKLIIGGTFTRVDGDTILGIASWNGNRWDSLGHGIDNYASWSIPGSTWAITRYGNCIYVGGNFRYAGSIYTPAFARWDGNDWDSVPGGKISQWGALRDIQVYSNDLYICGTFDSVGSVFANQIAKWDGTTWQSVGDNYPFGMLSKMVFYNGNLYVTGAFNDPSGNTCHLAKWNGTNWLFMTTAVQGSLAGIWDMDVFNNELYVSGSFKTIDGNAGTCIMRWNDTLWQSVGGGVEIVSNSNPVISNMHINNGKLYCGGFFEKIGGLPTRDVAVWDGVDWCTMDAPSNAYVNYLSVYKDTLYIGGGFTMVDNVSAWFIARWIGGSFVDTCGNTTGIDENYAINTVRVFPNPVNEIATFQFSGQQGPRTLIIFDQLGREIWRKESEENQIEFFVSGLLHGLYFFQVVQKHEVLATGKFIVENQ